MSECEKCDLNEMLEQKKLRIAYYQLIFIALATFAGVYQFVYKEITIPKSAPVNITLDLELKKISSNINRNMMSGDNEEENDFVQTTVTAENPSTRTIHLLPSTISFMGIVTSESDRTKSEIMEAIASSMNEGYSRNIIHKYSEVDTVRYISGGSLFFDRVLKPGEKVSRTVIVPVKKTYDLLETHVFMASANDTSKLSVNWSATEDNLLAYEIHYKCYDEIKPLTDLKNANQVRSDLELQVVKNTSEIYLN